MRSRRFFPFATLIALLLLALAPLEVRAQEVPPGQGQVPHIALTVEYPGGRTTVEGTGAAASIAVPPDAPVRLTLVVDSDVAIYDRPFVILRRQDGPGIARSFTPVTTLAYDLPVEGRTARETLVGEMRVFVEEDEGVTAARTQPLTLEFSHRSAAARTSFITNAPRGAGPAIAGLGLVLAAGGTWAVARSGKSRA